MLYHVEYGNKARNFINFYMFSKYHCSYNICFSLFDYQDPKMIISKTSSLWNNSCDFKKNVN